MLISLMRYVLLHILLHDSTIHLDPAVCKREEEVNFGLYVRRIEISPG